MKKFTQLVYYSISNIKITAEIIYDIRKLSVRNNSKRKITGCLLYHDNIFLQLIEGEKEDINNLYESIEKDKRHSAVTLVMEENVKERIFSGWSMAFHEFNSSDLNANQFIKNIDFFSKNSDKKTKSNGMFWSLAKQIVSK